MTKEEQNVEVFEGDTLIIESTVEKNDVAQDITNHVIEWYLYERDIEQTIALTKSTSGGGVTITDAANGVYRITVDPADTADKGGRYFHRARITKPNGDKTTLFVGDFFVKEAN